MSKRESVGTRLAAEVRSKCNKLTRAEREELGKLGKDLIEGRVCLKSTSDKSVCVKQKPICFKQKPEWCDGQDVRLVALRDSRVIPFTFNGPRIYVCRGCRSVMYGTFKYVKDAS